MILSYIARSQRKRLIYPFLLLLSVVFLASRTSVYSWLHMNMLPSNQAVTSDITRHSSYVSAPVERLYYTGEDYWIGGQLTGHYYYALIDGACQYYVIRASAGRPAFATLENYTVSGRIDVFDREFDTLNRALANRLNWSSAALSGVSSHYYINETAYLTRREVFFIAVLAVVFLGTLAALIRTLIYYFNPRLTPAYRKLYKYGNPETILADAEQQLMNRILIRTRDMVLTADYLIEFSEDVSAIIPLESVLWTYDHAAMHYTLRGRRLTYTIHVVTVHGDEYNLKQKSAEDVQMIYHELTTRYPDYFYGYSKEHQQLVKHLIKEMNEET